MNLNGDGYVDHIKSTGLSSMDVAMNQCRNENKLVRVNCPLDASYEMTYKFQGSTYDMPQSKWVLSSVNVNDGHTGDGVDEQMHTFQYSRTAFFCKSQVQRIEYKVKNTLYNHHKSIRKYLNIKQYDTHAKKQVEGTIYKNTYIMTRTQSEVITGTFTAPNKIIVSSWLNDWLWEYKKPMLKPNTLASYEQGVFAKKNMFNQGVGVLPPTP